MTQSVAIQRATWRDFKELTKPNVVALNRYRLGHSVLSRQNS